MRTSHARRLDAAERAAHPEGQLPTAGELDTALTALHNGYGHPEQLDPDCHTCETYRDALIAHLQADLDGYKTESPSLPACWGTHSEETA